MRAKPRKSDSEGVEPELEPWVQQAVGMTKRDNVQTRIAKIRELKLKKIEVEAEAEVLKQEKEVEKLKGESSGTAVGAKEGEALANALLTNPKAREEWLALDDAQRSVILASINSLKGSGDQAMSFLPLMMLQMKSSPTSNVKDMVDLIKTVAGPNRGDNTVELLKVLIPLIQEKKPEASPTSILKDAVSLLTDLGKGDREYLLRELERERNQPALSEQIRGVLDTASALGYQRGGSELEVEKLRIENDRWKFEQGWKMEQYRDEMGLKRQSEKDRMEMIKEFGGKFLDRAGPVIDAALDRGEKVVRGPSGTLQANPPSATTSPPTQEPAKQTFEMPCEKCGTKMAVEGPPFPSEVKCDKCGAVHSQSASASSGA